MKRKMGSRGRLHAEILQNFLKVKGLFVRMLVRELSDFTP